MRLLNTNVHAAIEPDVVQIEMHVLYRLMVLDNCYCHLIHIEGGNQCTIHSFIHWSPPSMGTSVTGPMPGTCLVGPDSALIDWFPVSFLSLQDPGASAQRRLPFV